MSELATHTDFHSCHGACIIPQNLFIIFLHAFFFFFYLVTSRSTDTVSFSGLLPASCGGMMTAKGIYLGPERAAHNSPKKIRARMITTIYALLNSHY